MDFLDYNIFVPTKNRFKNCSTIINAKNYKLNIIVELQDFETYKNLYPTHNYIVLPKSNQGITYVRNFIKEYTEKNGLDFYWQLDDDITSLYSREETKLNKEDYSILLKAQQQFNNENISLGALEYRQFAWSASKPLILNSFCDSCVYVDNKKTFGLRYNNYVEGKEDRDFAIQVIKKGYKTGRTTLYAFSAPPNGSNNGGLKEIFYDQGKEQICADRMVEVWGSHICQKIIKDNGRIDVKINWKNINTLSLF